jgi:predicted histone-like DNA-binding protein
MAIKYRLYQDNRAESKNRGKWYARAIYPKTPKSTKDLAQMIQDNVSVKKSDVIAVLDELVNVMKLWLQESYRVKLDGFGSFKIGLATKPADTAKDFSASKHVVGSRVNFQPETHWSAASGSQRRRVFLDDLQVEETPVNDVDKDSSEG